MRAMAIDALYPVAGNHAIQSVAFVFSWSTPLEQNNLVAVRACSERLKDSFPVAQEQKSVLVEVNDHGVQQPHVQEFAGMQFLAPNAALGPSGITRSLTVSKEQLVVVLNDYKRWEEAWRQVREWLATILPVVLDGRSLTAAVLQYNDQFDWRADPSTLVLDEILRRESRFLSAQIFNAQSLWHLHQGYIEEGERPVRHRLIENANITMADVNGRRAISLFTSHHAILEAAIWDADAAIQLLDALMDGLHDRNKNVMRDVFTPAVCQKINLA